jgi:hypothetical protein
VGKTCICLFVWEGAAKGIARQEQKLHLRYPLSVWLAREGKGGWSCRMMGKVPVQVQVRVSGMTMQEQVCASRGPSLYDVLGPPKLHIPITATPLPDQGNGAENSLARKGGSMSESRRHSSLAASFGAVLL